MDSTPETLRTLRRLPLFADLSESEMAQLARNVKRLRYLPGAKIFSEGDPCRELLIVEEGEVRILKASPNGRVQLISVERHGNSLAEVAVFDEGVHAASAEAVGSVALLCLSADQFRRVCLQNPEMALKVFKVLGHRLRRLTSLVEELSFSTVRERLIAYLLGLANDAGRATPNGIQFELNENNEELAARLGTVRELVSRNLGRLHGAGLIQMKRRMVIIPDLAALRSEIGET